MTISVRAIGTASPALPAFRTDRIGPGVTEIKTAGRMLPAVIRLANPVEPCARPWKSALSDFAIAGLIPPSIIEPIEPAYATCNGVRESARAGTAHTTANKRTSHAPNPRHRKAFPFEPESL